MKGFPTLEESLFTVDSTVCLLVSICFSGDLALMDMFHFFLEGS